MGQESTAPPSGTQRGEEPQRWVKQQNKRGWTVLKSASQWAGWRACAEWCHGESHPWLRANPGLHPGNELVLLKKPFPSSDFSMCLFEWGTALLRGYPVTEPLGNPSPTPRPGTHAPKPNSQAAGLAHGPGRPGRPLPSEKGGEHSVSFPSRIHFSPASSNHSKESNMEIPGIFSGRGSEGTSGSSICSCKKQRVRL